MIQYGTDFTCIHGEPPDDCPKCDPFNVDPNQPHTDLGNARRLVAAHGKTLRHVPSWRKWFVWDGARWARDITGEHHRAAKTVARHLTEDAQDLPDGDLRKALLNAARRAESAPGVRGMVELAATELGVALAPGQLDADPDILNTASGVLELDTGILRPHDPALNLTKVTAAAYDPDAEAPEFAKFLERIQPDAAMREFLARLLGHALSGRVREHVLPILYGVGANGKSTLVEVVRRLLGDYAATVDPGLLIDRGEVHPTGTADLFGLRLALTHESDQGRRLAEGTIKRLTGGDAITARRMREDFWSFEPSHSLVMVTNHAPVVTGTDEGIWRRLRIVPFEIVIPPDERDPDLPDRLDEERDGILRWLVEGYRSYLRCGLHEPAKVTAATKGYRDGSDMLGLFLDERCLTGPHLYVKSSELFAAWLTWCAKENIQAGSQKAFSDAIADRGFDKKKDGSGSMRWAAIGLASDE
jgi:putative DNA primase/helicase